MLTYTVTYCHRAGMRVTEFPVDSVLGTPFAGSIEEAESYANSCNQILSAYNIPGKCFAVLARDLTEAEIESLSCAQ